MSIGSADVFPGAKLVQLKEFGYPKGSLRYPPSTARAFSVIHITGNSDLPSAEGEASWRRDDPSDQNSATFFVNRDGSVVQCLSDPLHMAPWANGDVNKPDLSNRRIASVVADGINANVRTLVAIENVGFEPGAPLTKAQEKACADIIRYYHNRAGVPINRVTVVGHYQLNSVTRPNCPARDKSVIDRIVSLASSEEEDPEVIAELERVRAMLETCRERSARYHGALLAAERDLASVEAELADASADLAHANERRAALRGRIAAIKQTVATAAAQVEAA